MCVSSFVSSGNFCFEVPIYIKSGPGEELEPSLLIPQLRAQGWSQRLLWGDLSAVTLKKVQFF